MCLCSAKWICFYCQVFQIWLLIRWVIGLVVCGSLGKWSVVGWLVGWWSVDLMKPRKKHVWCGGLPVENLNLQIPHYHICRDSLKIQSRSLRLYFRNGRSSPYNFPFASLVPKTKTNMHKGIVNKRRKNNCLQRC